MTEIQQIPPTEMGISSDRSTKTILVTGATGDTGRPTVKLLRERGHKVKALVRKDDERERTLRDQGADVVVGMHRNVSVSSGLMKYVQQKQWRWQRRLPVYGT